MGKPSSTRLSRDHSNSNHKINSVTSVQKLGMKKKKHKRRTLSNVIKIVDQLKDENLSANSSMTSISSGNNTVIDLDASTNVHADTKNAQKINDFIVICDDEDPTKSKQPSNTLNINRIKSPIFCSTPRKSTLLETNCIPNNNNSCTENLNKEIVNLTKEINRDSYLTIDLTEESLLQTSCSSNNNTVIDLVNTSAGNNCTLISASNTSLNTSMSGDSDVTVLNMRKGTDKTPSKQMRKFVKGISKMDSKEKGKLLKLITETIFNGCTMKNSPSKISLGIKQQSNRATETVEDTYIKEVILGQTKSRNSIGSNIYNPERDIKNRTGLRMIVIDGSNVAMQHTMGKMFSVKGLKICIDYFLRRGHVVKAFVPRFRCKFGKSTEPRLLDSLERQGLVIYTPSREIQGRMITSYDDRYIVQCAAEFDGVIVSGDNYRDLMMENPRWRTVIENRLLQFTWVGDMIMFPRDPLGRNGPTLEQFLKHP